jgi:hypothetical protein
VWISSVTFGQCLCWFPHFLPPQNTSHSAIETRVREDLHESLPVPFRGDLDVRNNEAIVGETDDPGAKFFGKAGPRFDSTATRL